MNRYQFIRATGLSFLYIPLVKGRGITFLNSPFIKNSNLASSTFFPDKDNYLVSAICVFATPAAGDGKNGDDSHVQVVVDVECYDNLYTGGGIFWDNTEIESNVVRDMPIGFLPADSQKIFYDGVKNFNITIIGNKPNQDHITHDKWDLRWEFYMQFKKGHILSTGYNEPKIEYEFSGDYAQINSPQDPSRGKKSFFKRSEMLSQRTLIAGQHIG